jgi:hypothetical protein
LCHPEQQCATSDQQVTIMPFSLLLTALDEIHDPRRSAQRSGLAPVALHGKTLRGSFDHLHDQPAAHMLSAFASNAAPILAHQEVSAAPDKLPAVPELITELDLTGVLFTVGALHCQNGFEQAAATGNAMLVRVKRSQSSLHDALVALCDEQSAIDRHERVGRHRHVLGRTRLMRRDGDDRGELARAHPPDLQVRHEVVRAALGGAPYLGTDARHPLRIEQDLRRVLQESVGLPEDDPAPTMPMTWSSQDQPRERLANPGVAPPS